MYGQPINAKPPPMLYQRKTKTIPLPLGIPAVAVLLFGLYACTQNLAVGLLFVAVASVTLTLHEGVEIDFASGRIRLYSGLAGLKFGRWEALPAPGRLTLVPVRNTYTVFGSRTGSSTSYAQEAFEVRLHSRSSSDHYVVSTGTYETAKADAVVLSSHLKLAYEDFTVSA
jgi:hypothetical protein